jgi:hypothetical protein
MGLDLLVSARMRAGGGNGSERKGFDDLRDVAYVSGGDVAAAPRLGLASPLPSPLPVGVGRLG